MKSVLYAEKNVIWARAAHLLPFSFAELTVEEEIVIFIEIVWHLSMVCVCLY